MKQNESPHSVACARQTLIYTSADINLPQMIGLGMDGISNDPVISDAVKESTSRVPMEWELIIHCHADSPGEWQGASSPATDRTLFPPIP